MKIKKYMYMIGYSSYSNKTTIQILYLLPHEAIHILTFFFRNSHLPSFGTEYNMVVSRDFTHAISY